MANKILSTAANKSDREILKTVEENISFLAMEKDRDMEEAVERAIVGCGRGLDRSVSEARAKFEAESAEDRKSVIEEDVSTLRGTSTTWNCAMLLIVTFRRRSRPLLPARNRGRRTLAVVEAKVKLGRIVRMKRG